MDIEFIDDDIRIGCHTQKFPTLYESVKFILNFPVVCAQIYIGNARGYSVCKISDVDAEKTRELCDLYNFRMYVHACLLYNLNGSTHIDNIDELIKSATTDKQREKFTTEKSRIQFCKDSTIRGLIEEMNICHKVFGDTGVVVHIGSGEIKDKAIVRIADTINYVFSKSQGNLILENAAGEGNKIGSTLDEIADIIKRVDQKYQNRLFVCIDTCHLYSAGDYDIEHVEEMERFIIDFDNKIGLDKLRVIHLNDSEGKFGCRRDKHSSIVAVNGHIFKPPFESLIYLINFCNARKIDMVSETPMQFTDIFAVRFLAQEML